MKIHVIFATIGLIFQMVGMLFSGDVMWFNYSIVAWIFAYLTS